MYQASGKISVGLQKLTCLATIQVAKATINVRAGMFAGYAMSSFGARHDPRAYHGI